MTRILITITFLITTLFSTASFAATVSTVNKGTAKKPPVSRPRPMAPTSVTTTTPILEEEKLFKLGLGYSLRYSMQAEEQDLTPPLVGKTRKEYYTHELIPSVSTTNYRLRAILDFYDYFKAPENNEWDPVAFEFTINNPWALTDYFLVKPDVVVASQLFKTETQGNNLNSMLAVRSFFILNSKNTIPELVFKYGVQFAKFNLKENSVLDPKMPNGRRYFTDTRLRHRVFLGYMVTEKLMPMVFFQFDSNFLHDNSIVNNFYHETFIEYTFTDNISINVGFANGGGIYTGDYQDVDNLKFYNEKDSEYFVQLNFSI